MENGAKPDNVTIEWSDIKKPTSFDIQLSSGGGQFLTVYSGKVEAGNKSVNYKFKITVASDLRIVITEGEASISQLVF